MPIVIAKRYSESYKAGEIMKDQSSLKVCREVLCLACARTARKLRRGRSLSQEETAMRSNISQSYLSNIEQGKHLISLEKLCSLTAGLNVDIKECFELLNTEIGNLCDIQHLFLSSGQQFEDYRDFGDLIRRNIDKENLNTDSFHC